MTLHDIRDCVLSHRMTLKQFGVSRIGFFGSYVRGEQTENSDIDLLVIFEPGKLSFNNYMDLSFYLEELFQKKVDVLTPEQVSPYIMPYIQNEVQYENL